jgi:ribosomal protein S18 acetylase RimI-like enzyme
VGLILRPATRADADIAARLILEPTGGLNRIVPDQARALRAARAAFLAERSALSHTRAILAARDEAVVGQIIRFDGSEWPSLRTGTGLVMLRAVGARYAVRFVVEGRREERMVPPIAPGELYVMSLAVVPAARSTGIGAILLDRALEEARGRGLRWVALDVHAENEAAVRFYRREGFTVIEERREHPSRPGARASLRMRRSLA